MPALSDIVIQRDVPIPTWFGVGGGAERFARPEAVEELRRCLEVDPNLRVLGDGANLLVDDRGVGELVVSMGQGELCDVAFDEANLRLTAGAGVNLPKLILETVRMGWAGLEGLGGIPASIGGAAVMNAGGTFASFGDSVARVTGVSRGGEVVSFDRHEAQFGYRTSALKGVLVTSVELKFRREDPAKLRARLKEIMAFKKKSQPMGDRSAGCIFKNPTLKQEINAIGVPGARISAGLLIDRAGCKGMRVGGATVSDRHGNFIVAKRGCTAADVTRLMGDVQKKVADTFGVMLEPEVVLWARA